MTTRSRSALAALFMATGASVAEAQDAPAGKASKAVWEPVSYTEDIKHTDVVFVTPDVGWVSGDKGTMLHTKDGGKTWEAQLGGDPEAADPEVKLLRFFDERHGWAIKGEKLLATTDGESWEEIAPVLQRMVDFVFISPTEGFAAAGKSIYAVSPHNVFRTRDGGRTWEPGAECGVKAVVDGLTKQIKCHFVRLHFPTPSVGYAIGQDICAGMGCGPPPIIGKTEDGGETWRFFVGPGDVKGAPLTDLFFTGEQTGFVTSADNKLYATADGGNTWKGIVATPGDWLRFADPETGWSFDYSHLAFTTNAGARWSSRPHRFPASVRGLSFPRRDRAYVVGDHGMIMRYRVLDPAEKAASSAIAAPAMPPFVTPLEQEAAEVLAVVESLQEAGAGAPAGAASAIRDDGEGVAMEEGEESAALPADEGEEGEDGEGEVTQEDPGAAAGAPLAPMAPAKLGKLDLLMTALGKTVPSFLDQFTNLNLLAARLRSAGALPDRLSELKAALGAVRKAEDKASADEALAQALTAAQGLHAAATVAMQRKLPAAAPMASPESAESPAAAPENVETAPAEDGAATPAAEAGGAAEEQEAPGPAEEATEDTPSDDGLAAEAARAAEEEAKKTAKEKLGKSIKKKLRF